MKRSLILVGALCAAIAACGGDDTNNNPGAVCGDGVVAGGEQCDDGNTASGDGCSATCSIEGQAVCGDGTLTAPETCDDGNTTSGDGCSATCTTETAAVCGDNTVTAPEECDDGNTTSGDGCSMTCMTETPANGSCAAPFVLAFTAGMNNTQVAMATGDTSTGSSQVGVADCDSSIDAGGGNDHVYRFTLTETSDVIVSTSDTGSFDAIVRVLTAPCDLQTEVSEYGTEDGCSDADVAEEGLVYLAMPAGTYHVVVDGYDDMEAGTYELQVTTRATLCGNGMIDSALEECDDMDLTAGDGCDARCEVEAGYACDDSEPSVCEIACGNGSLDDGEECEDGGTTPGDRCSATCTLEYDTLEVESATPQAITATSQIIRGSLTADDVDEFTFTLTTAARVDIETYDAINNLDDYTGVGTLTNVDCINTGIDSVIALSDGTTDLFEDDDDGDGRCSYLGPLDSDEDAVGDVADPNQGLLQPGTYTIRITDFDGAAITYYILDLKITAATVTRAPMAGDLVINEFMAADGPAGALADTNCDSSFTDSADEFVELVNVSADTLDLGGVTISDSVTVRHTFAANTLVPPGAAYVVWGGGTPMCAGVTAFATASSLQLGLNDAGDTITVATGDATPVTLATHAYTTNTVGTSLNRSPDVTGTTDVDHSAVTGAVGNFSPGKRADGTAF